MRQLILYVPFPLVIATDNCLQITRTLPGSPKCLALEAVSTNTLQSSPAPAAHAPSPVPARTGTPAHGSRAASAHPDSGVNIPAEAPLHGDSTRRYLNTKVTGALLEGMKQLAKDK